MSKSKKLPDWDLSEYYKGIDDERIDKDLKLYAKTAQKFAKDYRGRVAKLSADEFLKALKDLEKLSVLAEKLSGFAYLNMVTQMQNTKASALYQRISESLTEAAKDLLFFSLEYNAVSDAKVKSLLADKRIAFYQPYLKRVRKFKPPHLWCGRVLIWWSTHAPIL